MAAADYKALVQSIYISYFGRPADTFGLASFSAQLDALKAPLTVNGLTAAYATTPGLKSLIDSFGSSAESSALYGTDTVAFVSAIYANVLNRAPDFDGLVFWVNAINSGGLTKGNASLAIMAGAINNTSAQGVIDAAVLANKVVIATNFTAAIDTGAELSAYNGNAAAATARDMLKTVTSTTVPATFQATVDATLQLLVDNANPGQIFALTAGVDTIIGTSGGDIINATFLAAGGTLSGFDSIDGGSGKDTLNIVDATAAEAVDLTSLSLTVKNVETVNVQGLAAVTVNSTAWTGITALNVAASNGTDVVTAGAGTAVRVTDTAGAVTVNGGSTVTIVDGAGAIFVNGVAGTTSVSVTGGSVTTVNDIAGTSASINSVSLTSIGAAAVVNSNVLTSLTVANSAFGATVNAAAGTRTLGVTVKGDTAGTIADATATTVNVTSTGTSSTGVTLNATAAINVSLAGDKALTLAALNAAAMTSLTVSDSALTTISAFGTTGVLTSVAVTGAGGLTADLSGQTALTAIDASASTGVNKVAVNATVATFTGGAGNDTVTIAAAPTKALVGGAGSDTIVVNAATDILAANTKVSGFEVLGLGTATTGGYEASAFAHLSIAGTTTGNVTFNNAAAGTDLSLTAATGNTVTYSLANATGTSDVLSLSLSGSSAFANSVVASGIETVNIATVDTNTTAGHAAFKETLTLSATAATKLVITGTGVMGVALTDAGTALTSVDASGLVGGGFSFTSGALAAAATIKGSAAGGDTINAALATAAVTITEIKGINSITGSSTIASTLTGGTGADTITGGAGNDVIVGGGGADIINGGTGADLITVSGSTSTIILGIGASGANTSNTIQTSELTSTFDVVKGVVAGDVLDLSAFGVAAGSVVIGATNLAAVNNSVVFVTGNYDAAAGIFSFAANGADTIVTYDTDVSGGVAGQSVILVGYHAVTGTAISSGIVTLA